MRASSCSRYLLSAELHPPYVFVTITCRALFGADESSGYSHAYPRHEHGVHVGRRPSHLVFLVRHGPQAWAVRFLLFGAGLDSAPGSPVMMEQQQGCPESDEAAQKQCWG